MRLNLPTTKSDGMCLSLTQPLTAFSVALALGTFPVCGLRCTLFFLLCVGYFAPHQSPIRLKAYGRLASAPDICPWHASCPRKPRFPTVSNRVQRTDNVAPSRVR